MSEICKSCIWSMFGEDEPIGQCHRYPPTVYSAIQNDVFPLVGSSDWCGEWRLKI